MYNKKNPLYMEINIASQTKESVEGILAFSESILKQTKRDRGTNDVLLCPTEKMIQWAVAKKYAMIASDDNYYAAVVLGYSPLLMELEGRYKEIIYTASSCAGLRYFLFPILIVDPYYESRELYEDLWRKFSEMIEDPRKNVRYRYFTTAIFAVKSDAYKRVNIFDDLFFYIDELKLHKHLCVKFYGASL